MCRALVVFPCILLTMQIPRALFKHIFQRIQEPLENEETDDVIGNKFTFTSVIRTAPPGSLENVKSRQESCMGQDSKKHIRLDLFKSASTKETATELSNPTSHLLPIL